MADTTTTTYGLTKPEVGASEDTWGTKINTNLDTIDDLLDGTTAIAPNLTAGSWKVGGTAVTSTAAELNILDGVTATAAELNILDGVTATAAELNVLDGITATVTELNYTDGVTSSIQTQLTAKASLSGATFTGDVVGTNIYATSKFGYDTTDYISWSNNAYLDLVVNGGVRARVEADGDLHADGDVIAYSTTISDERLKENIVGIDGALDKVAQLNGYTFTYKSDGKVSAGVIAQEVEKVLPEAVSEKELPLKMNDGQEYKVVNYDALHGLLIEAIKELSDRVKELEAK